MRQPDWRDDLRLALGSGEPEMMQAALARVPSATLKEALPYLEVIAKTCLDESKLDEALSYYRQMLIVEPDNAEWLLASARIHIKQGSALEALDLARRAAASNSTEALGVEAEAFDALGDKPQALDAYRRALTSDPNDATLRTRVKELEAEQKKEGLVKQLLDPQSAAASGPMQPELPAISFDPALLTDSSIPDTFGKPMVDGVKKLLWRYSDQQSAKNTLARLEDPRWLAAWEDVLESLANTRVLFRGSELGVFAARAIDAGATVTLVEQYPSDGRIAAGIVQKHLLKRWQFTRGNALSEMSEEARRADFEDFARDVEIIPPSADFLATSQHDCLVFPNLDHTLLGTGIVKAVREHRARGLSAGAKVIPAKAKLYAMPIEWDYSATQFTFEALNCFRWGVGPQPLDNSNWRALGAAQPVGEIDFEAFVETELQVALPLEASGRADALLFWFELELGEHRLSNAPGSALQCIRTGVQHLDSVPATAGQTLQLKVGVKETRLTFKCETAPEVPRSHTLPSWHVPTLLDKARNDAYREAIDRTCIDGNIRSILEIGSSVGLFPMMAAHARDLRVYSSEPRTQLRRALQDTFRHNGLDARICLLDRDLRDTTVPAHMPERVDLALFDCFDCTLIGEGVLHYLEYAREHLLKSPARCMPLGAKIRAMIIEHRVDALWGVDVNILNPYRFSPAIANVDADKIHYRALSAPFDVFEFDFRNAASAAEVREFSVPVIEAGTAGAVLLWFDLQLDEDHWLSNAPGAASDLRWKQGLQFLPEITASPASELPILAKHNGSSLAFSWIAERIPKEDFSKLPRLDPRAWQASMELDETMRGLLHHCRQHPQEYAKLAALAQRLAIDPAAHDLDPAIAQRFVQTFFG